MMILQLARVRPVEPAVRAVVALIAFLFFGSAAGQEALQYRLEVLAPPAIAGTLREGLSLARWKDDPQMTPQQLQRLTGLAVREAKETAATEGYFSAKVEVSIDESRQPWTVRVTVEPGPRTLIGEIDIRFSGPAADDPEAEFLRRQVRNGWSLRRGQPFRQEDWEAAKRNAVREFSSWRYAAARVAQSEALVDPETQRARLTVELASGPPHRFGEIRARGLLRYTPALVENLSTFRPGDVYDRERLVIYQHRLLESGYFVSAQADVGLGEGEPGAAAPVSIAVIEAPTQHVEAGLGYSTDVGARAELRYSNQDMFDAAWRFRSTLEVDDKIQALQLETDSPPQPGAQWNNFFARARQTDIQNEFTRELAIGTSHNWSGDLAPSSLIVSGHIEEQRVAGDVTDNRHAIYFGYRRAFRRTDDLTFPRSGYLALFEIGGAPPALASRAFLRAVASASLFIPNGRRGDLLVRAQAGRTIANSREGIPSTFLFRTGGDQSVRGYAFESLGVRQGDAIVGGRQLLVGSVEYTHWVTEQWGIAAFIDAGDAWDGENEVKAALGAGFGARFRTPIGPIRADLAYGERTGELRVHFSVGYTF